MIISDLKKSLRSKALFSYITLHVGKFVSIWKLAFPFGLYCDKIGDKRVMISDKSGID